VADIVAVGGCGIGVVFRVERMPDAGETLLADGMRLVSGGKAANQAIGATRLGAAATLLSAVGADAMGATARRFWAEHDLDVSAVVELPDVPTMVGTILIEPSGENRIALAPGALAALSREHVRAFEARIAAADVCLVSLEIGLEPAHEALLLARRHGVRTILNAAPAPGPEDAAPLLELSDLVTPNASEARRLAGGDGDPEELAGELLRLGASAAAITLGEHGALLAEGATRERVPATPVDEVIDTEGAGDAFNAALAVALAEGAPLRDAARYGCRAAALVVGGPGFAGALHRWDALGPWDAGAVVG
jgi:ribokinase